jgi:hypothetical protein
MVPSRDRPFEIEIHLRDPARMQMRTMHGSNRMYTEAAHAESAGIDLLRG